MCPSLRAISSANLKLKRLCAESERHGGSLTTFAAVAGALGRSGSRLSQLFGVSDAQAEKGISPQIVGALARVFTRDGIPLTIEAFYLDYESFVSNITGTSFPPPTANQQDPDADALPSPDWVPDRPEAYTDLATAQLHPPRPLNSRPDCYYLDASLRFENAEYVVGNRTVAIGVRQATLSFTSPAYQIAHMSLLGDAARPLGGVTVAGTGITVAAPSPTPVLAGNPLGEHHFAIIEPLAIGDTTVTVTVTLHTASRSFAFTLLDDDDAAAPTPSPTKDAILNLIYGEALNSRRDPATGRLDLAVATIRRNRSE